MSKLRVVVTASALLAACGGSAPIGTNISMCKEGKIWLLNDGGGATLSCETKPLLTRDQCIDRGDAIWKAGAAAPMP